MSTKPSTRDRFVKAIVVLAVAGGAFAAGLAYAAQPHMEAALNALLTAQTEMKVAEHDKAGHRVKALDLVNGANRPGTGRYRRRELTDRTGDLRQR
jgi:hypothetical protein